MGNAENKEIDLLLRRLGQREISASSSDPTLDDLAGPGDHLDPDELISFAEGVVPAAARSRYVAHVADCSRCRRIVAQLASGAGVRSFSAEPSKSRLWNSITGFFAPPVMRYGVPAMSLIILTAIGVVWFQQTRRADSVAQMSKPVMAPELASRPSKLSEEQKKEDSVGGRAEARTPPVGQEILRDEEKTKAKTETVATDSLEKEQRPAKPQAELKDVAPPAPAAAPAESNITFSPKPPNEAEESKSTEVARQRQAQVLPNMAARGEDARRNDDDKADLAANKKAEAKRSAEGLGIMSGGARSAVTPGSAGPTRTVAGRQFRRVDNTWIDTSYEPSTQTHSISRGSEQYRALVGDEPGLRMIAEQLEGEVIVIWKGRAYRIR